MRHFWEPGRTSWLRAEEPLDDICAKYYAEGCQNEPTQLKVYEQDIFWITLRDVVPYCDKHAEMDKSMSDYYARKRRAHERYVAR
jgi:hypothetical protein